MGVPTSIVELSLSRLVHQLGSEICAARQVKQVTHLLGIARDIQLGRNVETSDEKCRPELNRTISQLLELKQQKQKWSEIFQNERLGLYLCLGEIFLTFVAPNWLACFSTSDKEELFYKYFDRGPKMLLLRFLVGKSKASRGTQAHPEERKDLAKEVVQISRDTAQSLLARIFIKSDGVDHLLEEIRGKKRLDNKGLKELAILLASIADRVEAAGVQDLRQEQRIAVIFERTFRVTCENAIRGSENGSDRLVLFLASLTKGLCRRGFASAVAGSIHKSIHGCRDERSDLYKLRFLWDKVIPQIRDVYALEHLFYSILLADWSSESSENVSTSLGTCFGGSMGISSDFKVTVIERILLKRVLSLRDVRLVLKFISEGSHDIERLGADATVGLLSIEEVIYRTSLVWSKEDCSSLFSLGHQACLSMILIEGFRLTTRERLEAEYPSIPEILKGISGRLSHANPSVRSHGMTVARQLSLVLDPSKPLSFEVEVDFEKSTLGDLENATKHFIPRDVTRDKYEEDGIAADGGEESRGLLKDISKAVSYGTKCLSEEYEVLAISDESSTESDSDDESSLEAYDMSDDDADLNAKLPSTLGAFIKALRKADDHETFEFVLRNCEKMISQSDRSIDAYAKDLARALLYANAPEEFMQQDGKASPSPVECKLKGLTALLVKVPNESSQALLADFYSVHLGVSQRILILDALNRSATELSGYKMEADLTSRAAEEESASEESFQDGGKTKIFAPVSLSRLGKDRKLLKNNFVNVAHAFMLPLLCKYDHKGEGLDLVETDFVLLGKLLQTASNFLRCAGETQQAIELAFILFEFIESARFLRHKDAFVRKCTVLAIYQVMKTIPSFLLSASNEKGAGLNCENVHDMLLSAAKHDSDEDCRLLSAQVLLELQERWSQLLPKIHVLS